MRRLLVLGALAALIAGCGGAQTGTRRLDRRLDATCGGPSVAAPPADEPGVYRAGPLTLVLGVDLAQTHGGGGGASEAIAVVTGRRPVTATVKGGGPATVSFQFGAPLSASAAVAGDAQVRFPACGGAPRRFFGGLLFAGKGCARVRVTVAGLQMSEMLIPIGGSLRGCPARERVQKLAASALPFVGVACGRPDWIGCHRLGIGAAVSTRATLVVARIAGRLVTLVAPGPGATEWLGYLNNADYRRGPLAVTSRRRPGVHWYGTPEVWPRVQVTAFFPGGRVATVSGRTLLHPGYG
jgi:hypothetical protein